MGEYDEHKEEEFRSFRFMSNLIALLTVLGIAAGVGVVFSFLVQRPWYEGAALGGLLGGLFVHLQCADADFWEYWETQTKQDFDELEREQEEAWEKEINRPDDEYTGW